MHVELQLSETGVSDLGNCRVRVNPKSVLNNISPLPVTIERLLKESINKLHTKLDGAGHVNNSLELGELED